MEKGRGDDVCPWETVGSPVAVDKKKLQPSTASAVDDSAACPWDSLGHPSSRKNSVQFDSGSSSSEISLAVAAEVSERLKKNCNLQDRFGRRASSTSKTEGPRPSVSSMEDFPAPSVPTPHRSFDSISCEGATLPVEVPERVRKKSVSGPPGRKQSTAVAPVISVSSVAENVEIVEEEPAVLQTGSDIPEEKKESGKKEGEKKESEKKESEKKEGNVPSESSTQGNPNDICPWEDE